MIAEIISIGDEILIGQTVNTNASYLGQRLTEAGMEIQWVTAVGDEEENLRQAFQNATSRAQLVITTGGLGPTHDDVTKKVVAQFFNSPLVFRPDILEKVKERFIKRGVVMPRINEEQAWVPDKAQIIENRVGSAVGFIFTEKGNYIIVLPGVPAEMKAMMEETVLPFLQDKARDLFIKQKTLRTTGIFESALFEKISDDLPKIEKLARVAFLPKPAGVDIRLTVRGKEEKTCLAKLNQAEKKLRQKIGPFIYALDEKNMEEVVAELLLAQKKTIAVAESCTGGLVAHRLTNVPGSSDYFIQGVVAYSPQVKISLLGVPRELLEKHGVVSAETARSMAEGVRKISRTDIGLATTGLMGPSGGTPENPVGTVYVGFADEQGSLVQKRIFRTERLDNKERASQLALDMVRKVLLGRRVELI